MGTFYEPFDGCLAEQQSHEYCASLTPCLPPPAVQGSQTCDLHEGPERSVPTREDRPRSWSADLISAGGTHQESVCLP